MKHALWLFILSFGILFSGCPGFGDEEREGLFDSVPEQPTFEEHIAPLTAAYCNKCHSASPTNGAPPGFRTDICQSSGSDDGARERSGRFAARVNNAGAPMPPASEAAKPSEIEKQIFQKWHDTGARCDANDSPALPADTGTTPEADTSPDSTFAELITPVFENNGCLNAGCHGNGSASAGLDLSTEQGLMTTGSNTPMVTPCDPDSSYVVLKMRPETLPAGILMPIGGPPVSDGDLDIIKLWIADGADNPGACNSSDDAGVMDTSAAMDTATMDIVSDDTSTADMPDSLHPIEHPSFVQIDELFTTYGCNNDYCHGGSGGLNLSSLEALRNGGDNGPVVSPCDPSQSTLLMKLREETRPFGETMPLGGGPVTDPHLETFRHWIADGAAENFDASICNPDDTDPPLFEGVSNVAVGPNSTSCELSWSAGFDEITPAAAIRYRVYSGLEGDIDRANPTTTAAGVTSYVALGLTTGETYDFDVRAVDQADNESLESRVVSCTPR